MFKIFKHYLIFQIALKLFGKHVIDKTVIFSKSKILIAYFIYNIIYISTIINKSSLLQLLSFFLENLKLYKKKLNLYFIFFIPTLINIKLFSGSQDDSYCNLYIKNKLQF